MNGYSLPPHALVAIIAVLSSGCHEDLSWEPRFSDTNSGYPVDPCTDSTAELDVTRITTQRYPVADSSLTVQPGPLVGSVSGDLTFGNVADAVFLSRELLVVHDALVGEVIALDLVRGSRSVLARTGDGPGELPIIEVVTRTGDGQLVISGGGRAALFDASGQFVDSWALASYSAGIAVTHPVVRSASSAVDLVGEFRGPVSITPAPDPGNSEVRPREPKVLRWLSREGEMSGIFATLPLSPSTVRTVADGTVYSLPLPFTPEGAAVADADGVFVAQGTSYVIDFFPVNGMQPQRSVLCLRPERLSAEEVKEFVRRRTEISRRPRNIRELLQETVYPAYKPATGRLLSDGAGQLWIQDLGRGDGSSWLVLSKFGEWMGSVSVPEGEVADVFSGRIAAVVQLEFDVEAVRLYQVESIRN